jgi:hypothetical protein
VVITLSDEDYRCLLATLKIAAEDSMVFYQRALAVFGRGAESQRRWSEHVTAACLYELFQPIDYTT